MHSSTSNSERTAQFRWIRPSATFLATVGLILVIETVVLFLAKGSPPNPRFSPVDRVPTLDETIIQTQLDAVLEKGPTCEVILLGDSSCLTSLRPRQITAATGLDCWNLGTIGWLGIEGHVRLLEAYIANHGVPEFVVYHSHWDTWRRTEQEIEETGHLRRVIRCLRDPLRRPPYLPSMCYCDFLRSFSVLPSERIQNENTARPPYPSDKQLHQQMQQEYGWMLDSHSITPRYIRVRAVFSDYQADWLHRLCELADEHDFRLLVMASPLPEIQDTPENLHTFELLTREFSSVTEPFPTVQIYRPFLRFFPDDLFSRNTHLNAEGATRNTQTVIEWVLDNHESGQ